MSGKGSKPRPISDKTKYRENWDKVFRGTGKQLYKTNEKGNLESNDIK